MTAFALTPVTDDLLGLPVSLLRQSQQLRALHTVIRDRECSRADFAFFSRRIMRLLLEEALELLPFEPIEVRTPVGAVYDGLRFSGGICAVPIIRAGESIETELREMIPGVAVGKILIQRDRSSKLPALYYSHLPHDIDERHVLVLEPMIATGGSLIQAIDVLVQRGVPESRIIVANILASPEGLANVLKHRPRVRIVTTSIEEGLNEHAYMLPGIGDFGDRFFGTTGAAVGND